MSLDYHDIDVFECMENNYRKLLQIKIEYVGNEQIEEGNELLRTYGEDNLYLCYVENESSDEGSSSMVNICYFSSQLPENVSGDDWDDAPYEHNAGLPIGEVATVFVYNVYTPSYGYVNSRYTVEDINQRVVPWLTDDNDNQLYAGATYRECIEFMKNAPRGLYV